MREVASTEGSPALPIGPLPQPPRPLARPGSARLPRSQAGAPIASFLFAVSAPRRLTGPPANGGRRSSYSRTHFLFLPAGCARCAGTGWSPAQSPPFLPRPLCSAAPARDAVHSKKGLALGTGPRFSQWHGPISFLSPCQAFGLSENAGFPTQSKASNSGSGPQLLDCSQKLTLGLLLGKQEKVNLGTPFLNPMCCSEQGS